jgi:hypothetical protein
MNPDLSTLPVGVLVALGALAVVQLTLDVVALVDLYRRPAAQVVSGNKWIWVAVVGRTKSVAVPVPPASRPVATESIADALYGPRDDTDPR